MTDGQTPRQGQPRNTKVMADQVGRDEIGAFTGLNGAHLHQNWTKMVNNEDSCSGKEPAHKYVCMCVRMCVYVSVHALSVYHFIYIHFQI